ncbi:MAG: hypothetical protein H6723_09940 [Sandaracinus sp.]|nr:hypothetical protein [Sandaracinus sp.]
MRFASFALVLAGCGLSLDLSPPDPPRGDGAVSLDGGMSDAAFDGATRDGSVDGSLDAEVDAFMVPDAGMCAAVEDCLDRARSGAETMCAPWACIDGFCVENDYDGDGVGPGCENELDCDDFDPAIGLDGEVACPPELSQPGVCGASAYRVCTAGVLADRCEGFSAASAEVCNGEDDDCDGVVDDGVPSETFGAGRCATTLTCVDGAWNASAAMPAPTELCTAGSIGVDDDCDGAIDETCAAPDDCVYVRFGAAAEGAGTAASPVPSLATAFDLATEAGVSNICLLAGSGMAADACETRTYRMPTVEVGRSFTVIGGLRADAMGAVSRCATGPEATHLVALNASGIAIPAGVTLTLRDLVVDHPSGSTTVFALDVRNGGALAIHNVRVRGSDSAGAASVRRGIRVQGGTLDATASRIEAGPGTTTYAIDAIGSTVRLLSGCGAPGCVPSCADLNHGVVSTRGGVALRMSGGRLLVDGVAFCTDQASAGLQVENAADAVVVRSLFEMGLQLPSEAAAVAIDACRSFWMHGSRVKMSASNNPDGYDSLVGIDVVSCPALLTENVVEGLRTFFAPEISFAAAASCTEGECVFLGNQLTGALTGGASYTEAVGLWCEGGCAHLARNTILGSSVRTPRTTGLELLDSDATTTRNRVLGGCGEIVLGALVTGGNPRLSSNEFVGHSCSSSNAGFVSALAVEGRSGASFASNGNSYAAGPVTSSACTASALSLRSSSRFGSFVNDAFFNNGCATSRAVLVEDRAPAVFSFAGLVGTYYESPGDLSFATSTALEGAYPLFTHTVFTNAPGLVAPATSLQIRASSPFAGAGTRLGAPRLDYGGRVRPRPPSIGAWEP